MDALLPIAAKSFLFAGATLLLLQLLKRRSAADRSLIAHLGLLSLVLLPVAWLVFPQLEVASSWANPDPVVPVAPVATSPATEVAASAATFPADQGMSAFASTDWGLWAYLAPAGVLLGLTLIAVLRLAVLKSRAKVLVEPAWLSALAHAQRRMDFKNGTALLTSDELRSPISWGLMRPVILLNSEAANAHDEAEAIIAHELAHVTRFDWAKLLLSRVTVALFWFNPLVWLLAREAHQLREEAADDAVLESDIEDTDYAKLLVGIARHECRGMLIGAHGVAPGRNSLSRRVRRVLDAASARAPGGWRWTAAAGFFCAGMAVPLAALQFVPTTPLDAAAVASRPASARPAVPAATALAATGSTVSTSASATRTVHPDKDPDVDVDVDVDVDHDADFDMVSPPKPPRPPRVSNDRIGRAMELKAMGVTPAYVDALRRAAPHLRLQHGDAVGMAAMGVTPEYIRSMSAAGYGRLSTETLIELKALGVTADDVRRVHRKGEPLPTPEELVSMKALGLGPQDLEPNDSR